MSGMIESLSPLRCERDNFRKLQQTLEVERGRAKAASDRDTETIIELRTALEMERERQQQQQQLALPQPQDTGAAAAAVPDGFGGIVQMDQGLWLKKSFVRIGAILLKVYSGL